MAGVYKTAANRARGVRGKWSYWYYDERGERVRKTGIGSKSETLRIATKAEEDCRKIREGVTDPEADRRNEAKSRPVVELIEEWRAYILGGGATDKHARQQATAVRRVLLSGRGGKTPLGDVDWKAAPDRATEGDDSVRTRNYRLAAVRAFVRWLIAKGHLSANPLGPTRAVRTNGDAAVKRRVMTREEESKLFDYLGSRNPPPSVLSLSPDRRAVLYRFALGTGLRADEIRQLRRDDFDLSARTIRVRAETAKGRKPAVLPLPWKRATLLDLFSGWGKHRPTGAAFYVPEKTARLLQRDLKAAGVAVRNPRGVLDFHALRHTFVTRLVAAGVDVKTVQTLARHADVTTTLKYYAHPDPARLREAVDRIAGDEKRNESGNSVATDESIA